MTGVSLICIFLFALLLYILIIIRNQIESMEWNPSPNKCIKSTLNRIEKRIMWSSGWAPENRPQFSISICILMSRQLQLDYIDPSNAITHDCSSYSIVNYVEQLCRQLRSRPNARMSEGDGGTKENLLSPSRIRNTMPNQIENKSEMRSLNGDSINNQTNCITVARSNPPRNYTKDCLRFHL